MSRVTVIIALLCAACTGTIAGSEEPSEAPGPTAPAAGGAGPAATGPAGGTGPARPAACGLPDVGLMPLRRLTRTEYDRTVADLLGETTAPARAFPPDERVGPFDTNVAAPVSEP